MADSFVVTVPTAWVNVIFDSATAGKNHFPGRPCLRILITRIAGQITITIGSQISHWPRDISHCALWKKTWPLMIFAAAASLT